jgi:nucleoside-triphosphatase THEP1
MKQASARVADPIMCKGTCAILPQLLAQSLIFRPSEAYIIMRGYRRGRAYMRNRIAAVTGGRSAAAQPLFAALVAEWRAGGTKVAGVLSEPDGASDRTCTAGFLREINSGEAYQIHLETPPVGTSCDIDIAGVETAGRDVLTDLGTSDLVVLSKFGKLETMGGGLARAFEAAIAADKPLLTTVSEKHLEAWRGVAPGSILLPADEAAIRRWWEGARSN